ncbi:DUF3099 domain-containing protein [Cellulomonas sp. P24]|uniref:DUF3099 domain-containing protein n=1 Tax=Cellulomonas sp. P24 TaxID=2885206 RepID=UPI00216B3E4C|nr:DUF3099 domain-containing protein [Cellulomonas sp. P24]MCR6491187.1 DUF3099 domain-containing protein [Cellulomonas sp. P24]
MSRTRPGTSGPDEVHRITHAPSPLAEDQSRRERRYLVQMGIRVVAFLLVVVLWSHVPAWISWLLVATAVVMPYIAVLLANAGRERRETSTLLIDPRALGAQAESFGKDVHHD